MTRLLVGLVYLSFSANLLAGTMQIIKEGPIHEAFVTLEQGATILEAVPINPPQKIMEQRKDDGKSDTKWIPGYWSWSRDHGNFIWVSGTWRRPPPGHFWIPGYWKEYTEGWVRIPGFWSKVAEEQLELIDLFPPDNVDENIPSPPSERNGFFWISGYWKYSAPDGKYRWYSGRWSKLNDDRVYMPARYLWREEGYVMVPGYWDWPIDMRGTAYASVDIPKENRSTAVYEPLVALEPIYIMESLYPNWPNYLYLFNYHFHYHYDLWLAWGAAPPWWNWSRWWGFTWQDQWWLWWWWSHRRYPNPDWLTAEDAAHIAPPPQFVLKMMRRIEPPANVAAGGVVGNFELFQTMKKISGKLTPILPSDPKQIEYIREVAKPKQAKTSLAPTGTGKMVEPPPKPFSGPERGNMKYPPQLVPIPSL
ncbi:MAG: hypothetical protein WAM28_06260 [Chlamydiales bacterium]